MEDHHETNKILKRYVIGTIHLKYKFIEWVIYAGKKWSANRRFSDSQDSNKKNLNRITITDIEDI